MTFRTVLAASAAVLSIGAAQAQTVTEDQAKALQAQIKGWFTSLSGPALGTTPGPVQVTPAGDHFTLTAPLHLSGPMRGDVQLSADAKPLDGGRWSLTRIMTKLPLSFTMDMPVPPKAGEKGPPRTVPLRYTANAEAQDGQVEYDPSFATPSTWSSSLKRMTILAEGRALAHATAMEAFQASGKLTPAEGGLLDMTSEGTLSGYTLATKGGSDDPVMAVSMVSGTVSIAANGVSRDRVAKLMELATALGTVARTAPGGATTKPPPEMVTAVVEALQDIASDMKLSEAFEGIRVNVSGVEVAASEAHFGLAGKSEQGVLHASLDLGYDGLVMPDLGMGGMEQFVPRKVALTPFVSGVTLADLARIGTTLDKKGDPAPADIDRLFSHGGLVTGLEQLSVELAGASFTGRGKVTMTGIQTMSGAGQLAVENFDALVQKLGSFPVAQQAMPVVIFLKGIGKADGARLVWDINYTGGKLVVNNMDLSSMTGGPAPAPAPVQPSRPRPQGNRAPAR